MNEERTLLEPQPGEPAPEAGAEATQQAISITCGVCETPNPPGERWCQDCGFLLGSPVVEGEAPPDTAALPRLVSTGELGREFLLQPGENTVGRENAAVLLADPTVSRQHARLTLAESAARLEDLGSTNGTKLAGRRLAAGEAAAVYDGDELQFGSVTLRAALPELGPRPAEATQTIPSGEEEPPAERGPALGALVAEDGTEYPLYEGANPLGRRRENQIALPGDAYLSGRHAEFRCGADGCLVLDLGSTNGTVLREERLTPGDPVPLADGEAVRVGQTVLTLRWNPPSRAEDGENEGQREGETLPEEDSAGEEELSG